MIRDATIADLPQCMALGERLHAQTPYRDIPMDRLSCTKTYGQCISSALGFAMVAGHDRAVTGVLLGVAAPLWWTTYRYASDLVFYSERAGDGLKLLRAFVRWAHAVPKVVDITCGQSSGMDVDRVGVLYRRVGFERVGSLWCMTTTES